MPLFTESDLKREFSAAYLARGRDYQARGQVMGLAVDPDDGLITAKIRGSGKQPYRASIAIHSARAGRARIEGDCTCPVGFNCKHVVAALLETLALDKVNTAPVKTVKTKKPAPPMEDPALRTWLDRLAQRTAAPREAVPAPDAGERLIYLLRLDHRLRLAYAWVDIQLVRLLKAGGYGKTQSFSGGLQSTARCVTDADRAIFRWLEVLRQEVLVGGGFGSYPLGGTEGSRVLAMLLATGRCHWLNKNHPPLTLGAPRHGVPGWHVEDDGRQRIECRDAGNVDAVLPLMPPWYVDTALAQCGPLDTGLSEALAAELFAAPSLAPDQAPAARAALSRYFANDAPALPQIFGEARAQRIAPVPHLRLLHQSLALRADQQWRLGVSRLDTELVRPHFDYDGIVVTPDDPRQELLRVAGGKLARIARNFPAEKRALAMLDEWGFAPLRELELFDNPPKECAHDWWLMDEDRGPALLDFSLNGVPQLCAAGWQIEIDADYPYRLVETEADWYADIEEDATADWFGVALGISVDGERVNLLPLLLDWLREAKLAREDIDALADADHVMARLPDGRLLPIPMARVRSVLATLTELYGDNPLDSRGRLTLARAQAGQLTNLEAAFGAPLAWSGGERLRELGARLRDFQGIRPVEPPVGLQAELRDYQREGLNWLQFLREYELGGVLADDMGLGKTVQALAHLAIEKETGRLDRPALVIAPTSLMHNWQREAQRFTPQLRTLTLHGSTRHQDFGRLAEHDVIFTTYPLLPRDAEALLAQDYHIVILDEAQAIKNPKAKAAEVVRQLKTRHRLCLTGTPMENHLGELWSLFHFLMPGLLGDERRFRQLFRTPIEKHADHGRRQALARRLAPFLLRRTKEQVATELPPKIEMVRSVELEGAQRDLYESIRLALHDKVRSEIQKKGLARSQIVILDALLKLRQVCCDPRLLKLDSAKKVKRSAKLELLMEMLPALLEEGRRVLLFSQFTSMLALIEAALTERQIDYVLLTGDTRDRATPIDRFQAGEVPLFLISLKAGGTGLNLTAADTVIHYDPWWNPAVERQATDRAHRIGQDKTVFVYKLITTGSVEEKIGQLQARKQALADGVFGKAGAEGPAFTVEDLEALFAAAE